jgi:hypothetical protein
MKNSIRLVALTALINVVFSCSKFNEPNPVLPNHSIRNKLGSQLMVSEFGAPPLYALPVISDPNQNMLVVPFGQPLSTFVEKFGQPVDLSGKAGYVAMPNVQRAFIAGTDTFVVRFQDATLKASVEIVVYSDRAITTAGKVGYMSTYDDMVRRYGCKPDFTSGDNIFGYNKWGVSFFFNTWLIPHRVEAILLDLPVKSRLPHYFGRTWLSDSLDADRDGYLDSVNVHFIVNMKNDSGAIFVSVSSKTSGDTAFSPFLYHGPVQISGVGPDNDMYFTMHRNQVKVRGDVSIRLNIFNPCNLPIMDTILAPMRFEPSAGDSGRPIDSVSPLSSPVLSARAVDSTSIAVTWNSISGAANYVLESAAASAGPFSQVYSGIDTSFTQAGVAPNRQVWYRVKAADASRQSGWSGMATATPTSLPTSGLIAWYPFNGNAEDLSGYGRNLTIDGATPGADRFGNARCAYQFNNTIIYTDADLSLPPGSISYCFWVNVASLPVSASDLISKHSDFSDCEVLIRVYSDGTYGAEWTIGGVYYLINLPAASARLNGWDCICWTFDGQYVRFYLNGSYVDQVYAPGEITTSSSFFSIGNDVTYVGVATEYFDGKIDDIRIYNRALSIQEIQQLYHEGGWTGN